MQTFLEYQLISYNGYTLTVAMLLGMFLVWLVTTLSLRAVRKVINRGSERLLSLADRGRQLSVYLLIKYFVWTLAVAIMLEMVGIHVSVILAGSAALLVGLGLGVQQIFRDIVSGVFLLFEGTIEIGDIIELDGKVGRVEEINLRTSKLLTRDGHTMIIPNHKFITENVHNWTHQHSEATAFSVHIMVPGKTDDRVVRKALQQAADENTAIVHHVPAQEPQIRLADFQEKGTVYEIRFWTDQKFEVDNIKSDLRWAAQERLRGVHD
ncbi:MAG TPA: mechanosensitive ion channel domain-containing protein [Saprospiraceae bacterium]|nr:mechanosensitive ion channel domain-containing protein [Saprospiraceae bacterium]